MPEEAMALIREHFAGECADDSMAMEAIARVYKSCGYVMDPHTAVAWQAAEDYAAKTGDNAPCVVLSTASPCKFPASVLKAVGEELPGDAAAQLSMMADKLCAPIPAALDGVLGREVRFNDVVAPEEMMNYVMGKAAKA